MRGGNDWKIPAAAAAATAVTISVCQDGVGSTLFKIAATGMTGAAITVAAGTFYQIVNGFGTSKGGRKSRKSVVRKKRRTKRRSGSRTKRRRGARTKRR